MRDVAVAVETAQPATNTAAIAEIITAPESQMLLAEVDGELVGCVHVEARAERQAYLGMLTVRPGLQGQGVGRALVAKAEGEARVGRGDLSTLFC